MGWSGMSVESEVHAHLDNLYHLFLRKPRYGRRVAAMCLCGADEIL